MLKTALKKEKLTKIKDVNKLECAGMLCRRSRAPVPEREQPARACCRSWPTDPLSLSFSSALPRRAAGGGKEGKTREGEKSEATKGKRKEKKRSCWKYRGQREAGKAWNFLAVWDLEQQPTHPSPELLNSPSKLPAIATQTSAGARPCAKLCMTTQELSHYLRNNVHAKATLLRWKFSWSDVKTAGSTRRSVLNEERERHVCVYKQNDAGGDHLLK